ncbi:hypothetical protein MTO96_018019 [Rhipicephalus appendiculatus]
MSAMSSRFSPRQNAESTASRNDNAPKMSLVAQFDDFCRRVANDDDEVLYTMLDFVRNQEACRQRWEAAEKCCSRLAEDNESLVLVNSELEAKLRYTRDVLEREVQRRLKCEAHLRALNREHHMVTVLKSVLSQDNFASTVADKSVQSVLSPTGTTLSSEAHHSRETASRDISGEAHHMLLELFVLKLSLLELSFLDLLLLDQPHLDQYQRHQAHLGLIIPELSALLLLFLDLLPLDHLGHCHRYQALQELVLSVQPLLELSPAELSLLDWPPTRFLFHGELLGLVALGWTISGLPPPSLLDLPVPSALLLLLLLLLPNKVLLGSVLLLPRFTSSSQIPERRAFATVPARLVGRGEVYATTMTVVAGEPGYVATVTSQMEGSIGSSSSSQQRFRRFHSGPALLVQHSSQKTTKAATSAVRPSRSSLDESGVEEESGFVSRLERMGPLNRSTPLPEASQQQRQQHTFVSRPAVNPENCIACDKRIRFYKASFQCGACGVVCHPECESLVPLPCGLGAPPRVARGASGGAAAKSGAGVLADYAPSEPPFVPPVVVHCIREVERRCLHERGPLYGSAAPPEEVDALLGQLLSGRDLPDLSDCSLPVVCGALMKFLATLRETVVTKSVWPLLAKAAVTGDEDKENRIWKFVDATRQLPVVNRAVLSMLLVHLRGVSTTSLGGDGRSLDELAAVFAPVVVGCSTSSPSTEARERDRPLQDLERRLKIACVSRWTDVVKRKIKRSIGVGSMEPGNKK